MPSANSAVACVASPPAEPQRVGSDAKAPWGPERAQRSAPDLLRPFRRHPARNTLLPDAACGVRRKGVFLPIPGVRPFGVSSLVVQLRPLHPVLPNCFASWSQVLTDWHVCGALAKSGLPPSLASHPVLAAPLVAEVGRAIRLQQLDRHSVQTAILRERVVEPTCDVAGGPYYTSLRTSMEQLQVRYISLWRADPTSAETQATATEVERLQSRFIAARKRCIGQVAAVQRDALRHYWSQASGRGLGDDFFADCPVDSVPTLLSRVEPAWWWRQFFLRLQRRCQRFHAADGVFLDQLPGIRARVSAKKLSAEVAEWSKGMADRWGWDGPGHYRMLADRAAAKARALADWYEVRAPRYLTDEYVRGSLDSRLTDLLQSRDPRKPLVSGPRIESEHWRN